LTAKCKISNDTDRKILVLFELLKLMQWFYVINYKMELYLNSRKWKIGRLLSLISRKKSKEKGSIKKIKKTMKKFRNWTPAKFQEEEALRQLVEWIIEFDKQYKKLKSLSSYQYCYSIVGLPGRVKGKKVQISEINAIDKILAEFHAWQTTSFYVSPEEATGEPYSLCQRKSN